MRDNSPCPRLELFGHFASMLVSCQCQGASGKSGTGEWKWKMETENGTGNGRGNGKDHLLCLLHFIYWCTHPKFAR